jgi:uncharacterized protein (TIGR03437 family)
MFFLPILQAATLMAVPALHAPIYFEPNLGQIDAQAKFVARAEGTVIWFTAQGPVLSVPQKGRPAVLKVRFEGGRKQPKIEGEQPQGGVSNYFIGPNESAWHTDIPHFTKVRYRDVYPGIDVVFYGSGQDLEYDFLVAPGADPSRIRLAFDGADRLTESGGDLVASVGGAEIRNRKPSIRQGNTAIGGHYEILNSRKARIRLDAYDPAQPLVIDPVLSYATMIGGINGEQINGMAMDGQGNVIVGGFTTSMNFPVVNALYPTKSPDLYISPSPQGFITKFNPSASGAASVVFSTFFSSADGTNINALTLDKSGNIYVTGGTYGDSGTIPLKNAFQTVFTDDQDCGGPNVICKDAFVAEFNAAGNQLLFSSLLGGSNWDEAYGIAVDASQNIYLVGYTQSGSFPKVGPGQPYQFQLFGSADAFLTMVGPNRTIAYSTFFGGLGTTIFYSVAVDSSGKVYVAGSTSASQIAGTPGAYQTALQGLSSAILAKFDLTQTGTQALLYFTYLGGAGGGTIANQVLLDSTGSVYLAGSTNSPNYPVTPNALDSTYADALFSFTNGPGDGFIAKFNLAASGQAQLVYSTLVGGSFDDAVSAIALDSAGHITAVGYTNSIDFPVTPDAIQCCYAGGGGAGFLGKDGFIMRIDPTKSGAASILYSTLLRGSINTPLYAMAMDAAGNTVAVGGLTQSGDAPVTLSAFQPKFGGQSTANTNFGNLVGDAYFAVLDFTKTGPAISLFENGAGLSALSPPYISPGLIFTIKGKALGPATGVGAALDPVTGLVSNNVAGVQVLVDGVPVPLIYVSATQINAVAPYELATKLNSTVNIQTIYNGVGGNLSYSTVAATAPAIFSFDDGSGQGAIRNQDQSINGASNPAAQGTIVSIYATGEGQTVPGGVDGALANEPLAGIPVPKASASVTIGGASAPIQFIGTAPGGIAGFLQVNVTVPSGITTGASVPVVLTIGGVASQKGLTMAVK